METYGFLAQLLVVLVCTYGVHLILNTKPEKASFRSVAILVLGDMGRSPRMMYHAESWAKSGFETYLVGYRGSSLIPSLLTMPQFRTLALFETPPVLRRLPFLILAPLKIVIQVTTILYTLLVGIPHPPEWIMVQNPPSIPTLALVQFVCWLRGSKLIIDWHNLGYSILALRLGKDHTLVRIALWIEKKFGRNATIHIFVTRAMHDYLIKEWDLQGEKVVLYDRPPEHFHRASSFEIHELFLELKTSITVSSSLSTFLPKSTPPRSTPFTDLASPESLQYQFVSPFDSTISEETPMLRDDRPALLVSSTSWTDDEDFGMLLEALKKYEIRAEELNKGAGGKCNSTTSQLPKLLMIVTGKGPLKDRYMEEVMRLEMNEDWKWVRCRSLWLESAAYPILLGSADLGICMHASSSGLDLPMKVVDMFGCGLPVCALDFGCLHELVKKGQNGLTFHDSEELASQLETLLTGFPRATALDSLRATFARKAKESRRRSYTIESRRGEEDEWEWCTWGENWDRVLKPRILKDFERGFHEEGHADR